MSDIENLEEIMASIENAADLAENFSNLRLKKYVVETLYQAYTDIQVEVSSQVDNWQVV